MDTENTYTIKQAFGLQKVLYTGKLDKCLEYLKVNGLKIFEGANSHFVTLVILAVKG